MQHVIRHWQGSLSEADSSVAMQMDADFSQATERQILNGTPAESRSYIMEMTDAGEPKSQRFLLGYTYDCFDPSPLCCLSLLYPGMH